jgi:hypothetical protein
MLQTERSPVRFPDEVDFFKISNPWSRTVALGPTQPVAEMSTGNLGVGKGRPAHKSDKFTAICEPII